MARVWYRRYLLLIVGDVQRPDTATKRFVAVLQVKVVCMEDPHHTPKPASDDVTTIARGNQSLQYHVKLLVTSKVLKQQHGNRSTLN